MKRIFTTMLLSISVSILLLHSFVPHQHSTDGFNLEEILTPESVQSPIDLLKVGFHINLGANHLENFQKSKSFEPGKKIIDEEVNLIHLAFLSVDSQYSCPQDHINTTFPGQRATFHSEFKKSFSYRGPPLIA